MDTLKKALDNAERAIRFSVLAERINNAVDTLTDRGKPYTARDVFLCWKAWAIRKGHWPNGGAR